MTEVAKCEIGRSLDGDELCPGIQYYCAVLAVLDASLAFRTSEVGDLIWQGKPGRDRANREIYENWPCES